MHQSMSTDRQRPWQNPSMLSAVPQSMGQGHLVLASQEGTALGSISHEHQLAISTQLTSPTHRVVLVPGHFPQPHLGTCPGTTLEGTMG